MAYVRWKGSDMSTDSDDDIEILENNPNVVDSSPSANLDICQLCSCNLRDLSSFEKDQHYEAHSRLRPSRKRSKRTAENPASESVSQRKTKLMKIGSSAKNAPQDDIFWHPAQAKPPPDNYSPGVLSILKEALKKSHTKGSTQRAVLCYDRTPHIFRETFDTNWGCTYRTFMMTCAALMAQQSQSIYFAHLDSPIPPGVRNLQRWIEDAWKHDYDNIGATQLKHKLVDTKQRIGTGGNVYCFVLQRYIIHASFTGFDILKDWVVDYFKEKQEVDVNKILRNATPVVATGKMPVILQYQGHSVTIVGYELVKGDKINLLVLDPSRKVPDNVRRAAPASGGLTLSSSVSPLGKGKCREPSNAPPPKKRSRTDQDSDDEVVSIPDSDDEKRDDARQPAARKSTLDPETVIKAFRLKSPPKGKDEFQLLYFTMGDPLSDQEQNDRKVVLSTVVC
ncbi:peptidase family C78-domain-containing protein [Chiua virens]|nr:peptidase family C78-domain-containing protein [Chiua virens]